MNRYVVIKKIITRNRGSEESGLTIVEALVSLVILSLGLVPAIAVISYSLNISTIIKNNLIAANLAQEGIEVIHSLRDENWFLNKVNFYDDLVDPITRIGTWQVDWNTNWTDNPPVSTSSETASFIKFDSVTGKYDYSGPSNTFFKRWVSVTLSPNPCDCELIVVSQVTWQLRGQLRLIQAESRLYNWR